MTHDELHEKAEAERAPGGGFAKRVRCCTASGCQACGAGEVHKAFEAALEQHDKDDTIEVVPTGCMGLCGQGPLVTVEAPGGEVLYEQVTPALAGRIVVEHLQGGTPVAEIVVDTSVPFFAAQTKIVNENSGKIDATRIEAYIAAGGYEGLAKALGELQPGQVIDEIRASGLRGRGGGGYPTGLKWAITRKIEKEQKYVVCNADEGDPGAFMDRSVLESDPHRVLEGMAIAGYAVGATQGYIYVRAEYPLAIERLKAAIRQAERQGLLGNRILEVGVQLPDRHPGGRERIRVRRGDGAAPLHRGAARAAARPPPSVESGLFGMPGHQQRRDLRQRGADHPERRGVVCRDQDAEERGDQGVRAGGEDPQHRPDRGADGDPLRTIVFDIGGGTPEGTTFKAAQTGGPSGGCIPAAHLDLPVDYESLQAVGSIMGSGGLIVMDSTSSMVDVARYFMEFSMDESCGKCIPCRVGTVQLHGLLDKLTHGDATAADLELLEELCVMVKETSLCGLGQAAPNPVLSTLRFFRDEYLAVLQPAERS